MKVLRSILWIGLIAAVGTLIFFGYNYLNFEASVQAAGMRSWYLGFLFDCTAIGIIIFGIITRIDRGAYENIKTFSILTTPLLALSLIFSWYIIANTAQLYDEQATTITTQDDVATFIKKLEKENNTEKLTLIPTGLFLYSLDFPKSDQIAFSGYIWQKYTEQNTNLEQGIRLPEAIELTTNEAYREKQNSAEIIGWDTDATLFQEHNYSPFPFDTRRVEIPLAHKTFGKNVVLVPDFSDYTDITPREKPAIDTAFFIPGFTIPKTFFSFEPGIKETNFGLESYDTIKQPLDLVYNIILTRNLLNIFILYCLPLLVLLLSLFIIFSITGRPKPGEDARETETFKPLGSYVGFFFTLVFLHRFLRSQYTTEGLLYIEYFLIFTYITILFLVYHACTLKSEKYIPRQILPLLRPLFWPIQLAAWLITTILCFL